MAIFSSTISLATLCLTMTLLSDLSQYFEVSKQAIEIKLKKSGLLNDRRRGKDSLPTAHLLGALASLKR